MSKRLNHKPSFISLLRELKEDRKEHFRFVVFLGIAGSVSMLALILFLAITSRLDQTVWFGFDYVVNEYVHSFRSADLTPIVMLITNLGSIYAYLVLIPIIMFMLFVKGKSWKISLQSAIVLLSSFLLNLAIKWFIGRPRPFADHQLIEANFYSYPSGHAMSAVGFYGFLIYLVIKYFRGGWIRRLLIGLLLFLIMAIGMSRIYLGVHYPTDVLAGFIAGTFWLLVCIIVFRSVRFYRKAY